MPQDIHRRVLARFLCQGAAIGDVTQLLSAFSRELTYYAKHEEEALHFQKLCEAHKYPPGSETDYYYQPEFLRENDRTYTSLRVMVFRMYQFDSAWTLFTALLQQFRMGDALRKKVEQAARFWQNKRKPSDARLRKLPKVEQAATTAAMYLENIATARKQYAVALDVLASGKPLSEIEEGTGVKLKVGPFTLINTGNFSEAVMADVASALDKAKDLLTAKGLGKVCYGDVHVTKQISSGNVLAFYVEAGDELFIRAGTKNTVGPVRTIVHELAHRLHLKFLKSKNQEIKSLYDSLKMKARFDLDQPEVDPPKVGDTIKEGRKTLIVTEVTPWAKKVKLQELGKEDSNKYYTTTFVGFFRSKQMEAGDNPAPMPKGFVTPYASRNEAENFAELVSYYCVGGLSDEQQAMVEKLLS